MENKFEQYQTLLGCVSETAEACLDMEGGAFFLAWAGELIQDLVGKGYFRSARLTDCAWAERDGLEPMEKQAWLSLFTETLMDYTMTGTQVVPRLSALKP